MKNILTNPIANARLTFLLLLTTGLVNTTV
jgi:hypothetical protein